MHFSHTFKINLVFFSLKGIWFRSFYLSLLNSCGNFCQVTYSSQHANNSLIINSDSWWSFFLLSLCLESRPDEINTSCGFVDLPHIQSLYMLNYSIKGICGYLMGLTAYECGLSHSFVGKQSTQQKGPFRKNHELPYMTFNLHYKSQKHHFNQWMALNSTRNAHTWSRQFQWKNSNGIRVWFF